MTDTPMTPEELTMQVGGSIPGMLVLLEVERKKIEAAIAALIEVARSGVTTETHRNDCCCARVWGALGVTVTDGRDIADHVADLRADAKRLDWMQAVLYQTDAEYGVAIGDMLLSGTHTGVHAEIPSLGTAGPAPSLRDVLDALRAIDDEAADRLAALRAAQKGATG